MAEVGAEVFIDIIAGLRGAEARQDENVGIGTVWRAAMHHTKNCTSARIKWGLRDMQVGWKGWGGLDGWG